MAARDILDLVSKETGITQGDLAKSIGMYAQQLNGRLARQSLRADDFLNILDAAGIDVIYIKRDDGKQIRGVIPGAGRRVRQMVDRVIYDTAASDALANNFDKKDNSECADGTVSELYIDKEGRYFLAEYSSVEGGKDRITPVTSAVAAAFMSQYGKK